MKRAAVLLTSSAVLVLAGCGTATDAGVFRSTDAGASYISSSLLDQKDSIAGDSVSSIAQSPTKAGLIFAGLESKGVVVSSNAGANWSSTVLLQGTPRGIAFDPSGTSVFFAYEQQIIVTKDNGQTFDTLYSGPAVVTSLVTDPQTPTTVYAGTAAGQVVRSTNSGRTWNVAYDAKESVTALLVSPLDGAIILATTSGVFVSSDGSTFVNRTPVFAAGQIQPTSTQISALAQSTQAKSPLLAVGPGGLFVTTDAGVTWSKINEPVSTTAVGLNSVAAAPKNSSQVVITGGANVAKSDDGGKTWLTRGIATGRTAGPVVIVDPRTILVGVQGGGKSYVQRLLGQ